MAEQEKIALDNVSEKVRKAEYAVRGAIVIRAEEYAKILREKTKELPFDEIISCNIGNPQALGQKPISYYSRILAALNYPSIIGTGMLPADVEDVAKRYLKSVVIGAYSHSQGIPLSRQLIADFIEQRDGYKSDPEKIFLSDGASGCVQLIMRFLIRSSKDGVMIPIPQYPLYSGCIALNGGTKLSYHLDEDSDWGLDLASLESLYVDSVAKGINPRVLVVINPGNPTGQILSLENMKGVVEFCARHNVVLVADEVYQENIYYPDEKPFYSFKKVMMDMNAATLQLFSLHSCSKGLVGECGRRGGYMECIGFDKEVMAEMYKLCSLNVCCNVPGQILMGVVCAPPKSGDPSYEQYEKEKSDIFDSLKRRSAKTFQSLNSVEGITCVKPAGAMYAFPRLHLPQKFIEEAEKKGKVADAYYCMCLLDATGIVTVPGSGFGQRDGTYHFRIAFLPSEEKIDSVMTKIKVFQEDLMKKFK